MNRRQKIIVSITGIFIVLLALVGLTYAYFLTRIRGNDKNKSISVTTANLELVYGNDDGSIIGDGELIEPDTTFETKTFTVTNNGNATVDNYAVILEDVKTYYASTFIDENNNEIEEGTQVAFKRPEDFEINITCKITASPTAANIGKDCTGYTGTLPLMDSETLDETYITNGILLTNSIEVGETQTYSVVLKYKEANDNQSDDMNKRLNGKFNIIDANNTVDITGTVTGYSTGDIVQTNSIQRQSQINSDGTYKIVGLEADVHSVKVVSDDIETEINKISIVKGKESSVGTTTHNGITIPQLTITDASRETTLNIDANDNKVTTEEVMTYSLAQSIISNARNKKNGTIFSSSTLSAIGDPTLMNVEKNAFKFKEYYPYIETIKQYNEKIYYGPNADDLLNCIYYGNSCESTDIKKYTECNESVINNYMGDTWTGSYPQKIIACDNGMPVVGYSENKNEKTLSVDDDNYGKSYYFRGDVQDNYLNFAEKCWRIVRIQGDGSIKLLLEDNSSECDKMSHIKEWNIGMNTFSHTSYPVGSLIDSTGHKNPTQVNVVDDFLGTGDGIVKSFYDYQQTFNNDELSKLKSGGWCLNDTPYKDKDSTTPLTGQQLIDERIGDFYTNENGFEYNFGSYIYKSNDNLKCNGSILNEFKDVEKNSVVKTKKQPMYVATLTRGEILYAGGVTNSNNTNYYINNNMQGSIWTMTLSEYYWHDYLTTQASDYVNLLNEYGIVYSGMGDNTYVYNRYYTRPSIVLKSNTLISSGDGTQMNPYVVK